MKKIRRKPLRRTITVEELQRLSFCNSDKLIDKVTGKAMIILDNGLRKQWVGIGWIVLNNQEVNGTEWKVVR